jgi:hypothetical protein
MSSFNISDVGSLVEQVCSSVLAAQGSPNNSMYAALAAGGMTLVISVGHLLYARYINTTAATAAAAVVPATSKV